MVRRSDFWQVTCFCSRGMRNSCPEEEFRNSEVTARLRQCTALLSPTLRRTFQLRVVDGLSIFETARILGVPHGTVKAQLARARAKLARHMRPVLTPSRRTPQRLHK